MLSPLGCQLVQIEPKQKPEGGKANIQFNEMTTEKTD